MSDSEKHEHAHERGIELLNTVLQITRDQLSKSMSLSTELEALLLIEREKTKKLEERLSGAKSDTIYIED